MWSGDGWHGEDSILSTNLKGGSIPQLGRFHYCEKEKQISIVVGFNSDTSIVHKTTFTHQYDRVRSSFTANHTHSNLATRTTFTTPNEYKTNMLISVASTKNGQSCKVSWGVWIAFPLFQRLTTFESVRVCAPDIWDNSVRQYFRNISMQWKWRRMFAWSLFVVFITEILILWSAQAEPQCCERNRKDYGDFHLEIFMMSLAFSAHNGNTDIPILPNIRRMGPSNGPVSARQYCSISSNSQIFNFNVFFCNASDPATWYFNGISSSEPSSASEVYYL